MILVQPIEQDTWGLICLRSSSVTAILGGRLFAIKVMLIKERWEEMPRIYEGTRVPATALSK